MQEVHHRHASRKVFNMKDQEQAHQIQTQIVEKVTACKSSSLSDCNRALCHKSVHHAGLLLMESQ